MDAVRVAIAGVGNCASALVQGAYHYRRNPAMPGIMSDVIGGRGPGDLEFVAAFDVNASKVGVDLSTAIHAKPNNTRIFEDVPYMDITVVAGPRLDGIGSTYAESIDVVSPVAENVSEHLRATRADVLVNFLPVGSEDASRFYALAALEAGCAFVNAIPTRVARDEDIASEFERRNVPLIGDDVKSQLGATYVHRVLAEAFSDRGIYLHRTYQLNVGGNMDFKNMLDQERLAEKRASKTEAVTSVANAGDGLEADDVHIGPSDYVPWLGDRKVALIRMEGAAFGGSPLEIDVKMTVWDSPNSAGVVVDAVRYAKRALEEGRGGVLAEESAWLMKAPERQMNDHEADRLLREREGATT